MPFQVRLTPTEQRELFALAALDGISASDVFRQFIRNSYRERSAEMPPMLPREAKP